MPSSAIDGQLAAWLKSESLTTTGSGGSVAWSALQAVDVDYLSPLDSKFDAQSVSALMATFLAGPLTKDKVIVGGARRDLLFKCITVVGRKGYGGAGKKVFVIGVAEKDNGTTDLTVLRSLA